MQFSEDGVNGPQRVNLFRALWHCLKEHARGSDRGLSPAWLTIAVAIDLYTDQNPSKSLRQTRVELGSRRDAVQAEIAAEIELQVRGQGAGQSFIQGVERLVPGLKRLGGEDLGIEGPTLVERMADIDQEVEGCVVAAVGGVFQIEIGRASCRERV